MPARGDVPAAETYGSFAEKFLLVTACRACRRTRMPPGETTSVTRVTSVTSAPPKATQNHGTARMWLADLTSGPRGSFDTCPGTSKGLAMHIRRVTCASAIVLGS